MWFRKGLSVVEHETSILFEPHGMTISNHLAYLARAESQEFDRRAIEEFGMLGLVLMENAGRGCVDQLVNENVRGPVLILCGPGNNGGDGWVIARHLALRKIPFQLVSLTDPINLTGDAKVNYEIARRLGFPIQSVGMDPAGSLQWIQQAAKGKFEWIVDAILGTGARIPLTDELAEQIAIANGAPAKRLAIDLPTGVECDSGEFDPQAFRADLTCTFVAKKNCMKPDTKASQNRLFGKIIVVDIGIPKEVVAY